MKNENENEKQTEPGLVTFSAIAEAMSPQGEPRKVADVSGSFLEPKTDADVLFRSGVHLGDDWVAFKGQKVGEVVEWLANEIADELSSGDPFVAKSCERVEAEKIVDMFKLGFTVGDRARDILSAQVDPELSESSPTVNFAQARADAVDKIRDEVFDEIHKEKPTITKSKFWRGSTFQDLINYVAETRAAREPGRPGDKYFEALGIICVEGLEHLVDKKIEDLHRETGEGTTPGEHNLEPTICFNCSGEKLGGLVYVDAKARRFCSRVCIETVESLESPEALETVDRERFTASDNAPGDENRGDADPKPEPGEKHFGDGNLPIDPELDPCRNCRDLVSPSQLNSFQLCAYCLDELEKDINRFGGSLADLKPEPDSCTCGGGYKTSSGHAVGCDGEGEIDQDYLNAQKDLEKSRPQILESANLFMDENRFFGDLSDFRIRNGLTDFAMQEIAEFCGFEMPDEPTKLDKQIEALAQGKPLDELRKAENDDDRTAIKKKALDFLSNREPNTAKNFAAYHSERADQLVDFVFFLQLDDSTPELDREALLGDMKADADLERPSSFLEVLKDLHKTEPRSLARLVNLDKFDEPQVDRGQLIRDAFAAKLAEALANLEHIRDIIFLIAETVDEIKLAQARYALAIEVAEHYSRALDLVDEILKGGE